LDSLTVFFIALVAIFGGALLGVVLRKTLPESHLSDDAKDIVRLGTALIGTIAALVLSLLIASANSSYGAQSGELQRLTANCILVDELLAQYGPETQSARQYLRQIINPMVERIWQQGNSSAAKKSPFRTTGHGEAVLAAIEQLSPQNAVQRSLKDRAFQASVDLGQTRLLLLEQSGSSIPVPFLAILIFWLAMIFTSYGLFSRVNPTVLAALFVYALSASAAIFLILELGQPFSGLMQISSAPLRHALAPL
jgi:uncharacterized protein DUF4239